MASDTQISEERFHIGHYIDACNEIVDRLQRKASGDAISSNRLNAAFKDIRDRFFNNPDTFTFKKSIEVGLQGSHLYEDMTELVAILQGSSELIPLPTVKLDGAGRAYEAYSVDEQKDIRSKICAGVAIKIKTVISELRDPHQRTVVAKEGAAIRAHKEETKAAFDVAAAAATRRRELRQTEAGCIELVRENGLELENLDPIFQNNRNVVFAAVTQHGRALRFAHERLRNDNGIVIAALSHPDSDFIIQYAGEAFRANRVALLEAIRTNEMVIGYGLDEAVEDRAFLLASIDANPMVIQLFNEALRNDREIVLRALKALIQRGEDPEMLLQVVGQEMRPFVEVYCRVINNPESLENLHERWRNDREIVLAAVRQNGYALQWASEAFRNDREVVLEALNQDGHALRCVGPDFINNREIVLIAVRNNGYALSLVSLDFKNDKEIVLAAVRQNGNALGFASELLQDDPEVVLAAVGESGDALIFASERLQDDLQVVSAAVRQNRDALKYASEALRNNSEILLATE